MRKIRKLSFFGILGVVIAVLFLISISFTQAQVKIQKKPVEPQEATWAVQLPDAETEGTMLYGDGAMYINDGKNVIIKVEKGKSMLHGGGKRQIVFYYYFCFKLLNPTVRYAGFQKVDLNGVAYPAVGPYCIFPEECGSQPATTCLGCFINQDQPHPKYEYFYLKFQVGQGSFTAGLLGNIIEGIEDENWDYNVPVKFTSFSDWIKFRVQNQEDFLNPDTEYHNIECDERNHDDDDLTNMNIWIEKLNEDYYTFHDETITGCDGVWRIYVGIIIDTTTGVPTEEDLWVQEQYTQRVAGKGKKGAKTVTVFPLEAIGNFSFYIDFIKNPKT